MIKKSLNEIIDSVSYLEKNNSELNPEITGLAYDSRDVKPGYLFFALKGIHSDGHQYIQKAVDSGASAIVYSDRMPESAKEIPSLKVTDTRKAMAPLSACFYDHPSATMKVIGVTGTDGKSSTVSYIAQMLTLSGHKAGLISTVSFDTGEGLKKNFLRQSTPESPEIQKLLYEMLKNGLEFAVIESTSHGLSEKTGRLDNIEFDAAVFTNVTHEHLEFHGSVEQYRKDKSRLFSKMAQNPSSDAFGVINASDPHSELFIKAASPKACVSYSLEKKEADMYGEILESGNEGTRVIFHYRNLKETVFLPIPGSFNVENMMATLLTVSGVLHKDVRELLPLISKINGVSGRMKLVTSKAPFTTMVDYAHTPGSFEKLFPSLRKQTKGKIICIFGSGGERDIEKRPTQGKIADQWADIIILSNEDPRLEDEMKILNEIASGIKDKELNKELFLIPDRPEAFRTAISLAGQGDLVVGLGKGHEGSIIMSDGPHEWDEERELKKALTEAGF